MDRSDLLWNSSETFLHQLKAADPVDPVLHLPDSLIISNITVGNRKNSFKGTSHIPYMH